MPLARSLYSPDCLLLHSLYYSGYPVDYTLLALITCSIEMSEHLHIARELVVTAVRTYNKYPFRFDLSSTTTHKVMFYSATLLLPHPLQHSGEQ